MQRNLTSFLSKYSEQLTMLFLFLIAVSIRWYQLDQHLFFGFEQGRDAQIIQDIYQKADFKLVGPKTDLPGIFHGAYYYYLLILPYAVTHGNPLAGSLFLVLLSSVLPVVMYLFGKSVFESKQLGAVTGLLAAMSYEYIIYARWLSNVTPAIVFIALTFYFLWLYRQQKKQLYFVVACVSAAVASQFEVVLVLLLGFAFVLYFVTKVVPFPKWKTLLAGILSAAAVFAPHMLYNLRNQNIIVRSVLDFVTHPSQKASTSEWLQRLANLRHSYTIAFERSLSLSHPILVGVLAVFILSGIALLIKQKRFSKNVVFFIIWFLMALPVILFHDVAQLYQLYLGVGLSIIFLFIFGLKGWVQLCAQQKNGQTLAGLLLAVLSGVFIYNWTTEVIKLHQNRDVFFITIQEGMNYADQQKLLQYVHQDAGGKIYRFEAFTIPYLQQEGWQYLQNYFHPNSTDKGSKLVYIAIEKQVDPFWEKKWIEDLGPSQLVDEKMFGLLRLQKRILK